MSWKTLIEQQSTLRQTIKVCEGQKCLIPLPGIKLIRVSGEEAGSFLQNLLTNDVNALQINDMQLSGFCNPKGRLLTVFQLIRRERDYLIALPADLAESISQRLTMFKLRSKVDITLTDTLHAVGLVNASPLQKQETDAGLVIQQPGPPEHALMICDENQADNLSSWLDNDWQLGSEALWQILAIKAGIPMIFADSKEAFTPQQVNLDLVGGVSFKKGCYPGQEVVARLHYLGSPSRRMFLASLNSSQLPAINSPVLGENGDTLGHVVQAQFEPDNRILCQLSLKLSSLDKTARIDGQPLASIRALAEDE